LIALSTTRRGAARDLGNARFAGRSQYLLWLAAGRHPRLPRFRHLRRRATRLPRWTAAADADLLCCLDRAVTPHALPPLRAGVQPRLESPRGCARNLAAPHPGGGPGLPVAPARLPTLTCRSASPLPGTGPPWPLRGVIGSCWPWAGCVEAKRWDAAAHTASRCCWRKCVPGETSNGPGAAPPGHPGPRAVSGSLKQPAPWL